MAATQRLEVHYPQGTRSIDVDSGESTRDVAEILRHVGLPLNTRCGRQGLCNGCLVELTQGVLERSDAAGMVSAEDTSSPLRACQHRMPTGGDAVIRVPARSLLRHEPQIVSSFRCNVTHAFEPLWQLVRIPRANGTKATDFAERLCRGVSERLAASLPVRADGALDIAAAPGDADLAAVVEYRGDHWSVRSLGETIDSPAYGIAVDVGTTTVVVLLIDLFTGDVAGTASALNTQTYLGDNVLTRINLCMNDKSCIRDLQAAVVDKTLAPLIDQVLAEADAAAEQIVAFCVAGNTTMLHLLAGDDPSGMGAAPFPAQFLDHRMLRFSELPVTSLRRVSLEANAADSAGARSAASVGSRFGAAPLVHLLPGAAAYVGADITAGVFASGMAYDRGPCLLVDVGTNGEIVLSYDGQLIGCATAAGPAFEGSGMSSGVRAGKGAISHVRLEGEPPTPQIEVIGGGKPIGLCGTGYVDFVAEAHRCGLIRHTGRISDHGKESGLVRELRHGRGFAIAPGRGKEPLVVAEADIAALLQAKAAIAAGILCLLSRFELTAGDIRTVYLAGGFGFHMDLDHLVGIGLLPGFRTEQIHVVGNTALAGAYLALLDASALEEIKRISQRLEIVELNLEPDFTSRYIDQLFLP
jgi:uncharacterized 2Fe-2S/4Fe-4S cluster protein (DUF4445 family)